jgi:hypothetical protein
VAATPSLGAVFDVVVRCDGTAPDEPPLGDALALAVRVVRDALALALPLALPAPVADVFALLPALAVVPLLGAFRLAAALFGFADALRVARAAVDAAAAGLAIDTVLAAAVSDFVAVSIALVAELMAAIAEAIDLAEVVAFLTASFSFVVAALTLAACDETSRDVLVVLVLLVVATDLPSS